MAKKVTVEKVDLFEQHFSRVLNCYACSLSETRNSVVFGSGSRNSKVMFIGEAPGKDEDLQGRPFVGAAGRVLDEMLGYAGIERKDVFITNATLCRPPNNRDPEPKEKAACRKHLDKTIELINPVVICTLGRHAMTSMIGDKNLGTISELHGKAVHYKGRIYMPMFHPAASLYNRDLRPSLKADFIKLKKLLTREKIK